MLGDGGRLWAVWLLPFAAAVWPGGTSRSGAVAALYCWCRCGHPSLRGSLYSYQSRTGGFLGRRSGPTCHSRSWSSVKLMVNSTLGYVSTSNDHAKAVFSPTSSIP